MELVGVKIDRIFNSFSLEFTIIFSGGVRTSHLFCHCIRCWLPEKHNWCGMFVLPYCRFTFSFDRSFSFSRRLHVNVYESVFLFVHADTQWNRACLASHRLAQEQCIGELVECCDRYYWHRHDEIYTEHSTPHNTLLNESKCTTCTPNEMNNKEPENSEEMKKEYKKNMQRKVRALPLD